MYLLRPFLSILLVTPQQPTLTRTVQLMFHLAILCPSRPLSQSISGRPEQQAVIILHVFLKVQSTCVWRVFVVYWLSEQGASNDLEASSDTVEAIPPPPPPSLELSNDQCWQWSSHIISEDRREKEQPPECYIVEIHLSDTPTNIQFYFYQAAASWCLIVISQTPDKKGTVQPWNNQPPTHSLGCHQVGCVCHCQ